MNKTRLPLRETRFHHGGTEDTEKNRRMNSRTQEGKDLLHVVWRSASWVMRKIAGA